MSLRIAIAIAFAGMSTMTTFVAPAQAQIIAHPPAASAPPVSAPPALAPPAASAKTNDKAKAYVPGLAQFMNAILAAHNKLWFAGRERNWPLAAYELAAMKEIIGDVRDVVPVFKNRPLANMLDAVRVKEIADLQQAIAAKDSRAFVAGYDRLDAACNACHRDTDNGFIVIRRPARPAFTDQDFRPRH